MLVLCVVWGRTPVAYAVKSARCAQAPTPCAIALHSDGELRTTRHAALAPALHRCANVRASISPLTRWTESIDRPIWRLGTLQLTCEMENTGFDYIVKPLEDFAKGSIRLVKRCTKPDKKGEEPALLCLDDSLVSATCVYAWRLFTRSMLRAVLKSRLCVRRVLQDLHASGRWLRCAWFRRLLRQDDIHCAPSQPRASSCVHDIASCNEPLLAASVLFLCAFERDFWQPPSRPPLTSNVLCSRSIK